MTDPHARPHGDGVCTLLARLVRERHWTCNDFVRSYLHNHGNLDAPA